MLKRIFILGFFLYIASCSSPEFNSPCDIGSESFVQSFLLSSLLKDPNANCVNFGSRSSSKVSLSIRYPESPFVFTIGSTITTKKPTVEGGISICKSSPSFPSGLVLNEKNCEINGFPTSSQPATTYLITASDGSEVATATIIITINANSPGSLVYANSPFTFTNGAAIPTQTPSYTGTITLCTSSPNLPTGFSLDNTTCAISGTPTANQVATTYTITATNGFGNTSTDIIITVNTNPPSSLVYAGSPFTFTQNAALSTITPTVTGTVTGCSSVPTLPTGLSLNSSTCAITGTPTITQGITGYTITASNAFGNTTANIQITINIAPPSALTYTGSPFTFTDGATISTITPTVTGTVTSCSASPTLPTGLGINNTTCVISGTPSGVQGATGYTITASNGSGSTTANIIITVNIAPPSSLSYAGSPYTFTQNATISTITPTVTGTVTSCSASPTLPLGLGINSTTCAISGTPTVNQGATGYTITASNGSGSTTANINITVNIAPPSSLTYAGSPYVFTQNATISTITPTVTGTVTSCSTAPALPLGLGINNTTCAITGTPTTVQGATGYTITASNGYGSTTANINITINIAPPSALVYAGSPFTFTQNATISTVTPTVTGTVTSCSASPTLPTGLGINNTTCAITGTPTAIQGATGYTITASNGSGSTTANITITINIAPPSALTYTGSPYTFTQNATITTLTPTVTGTVTGCSASPTLPTGLGINNTTCAISGTPTVTQGSTAYTITASNGSGSTTANISITINIAPPTALTYAGSPYTFTQNATISTITPTVTGTVTSCSASPTLPTGLGINNTTCAISGTPTVTQGSTAYTITASNGSGNTTANINITINIAPPTALTYAGSPYTFTQNSTITTVTPTVTGTVTSCSASPTLPTGLGINNTTCAISGTPITSQASTAYTITASNGSGNTTANINIAINIAPPTALTYTGSPYVFINGNTITTITPTVTGTVTSCSSAPALPTGLSIDNTTCAISGTPSVLQGATGHTITASNGSGSTTANINITVSPVPTKDLLTFSFASLGIAGTFAGTNVSVTVPFGTNVTALVATFTHNGSNVRISGVLQTSGTTANNFTTPVTYTVTATDATTQNYIVTVTVLPNPGKAYYGTLTARAQRYGNAQTLTGSTTQIFDPADTFKLATAIDTQRDILYVGMGDTGTYSIHVFANASTNTNVLSRTITITTMHRVAGLALDIANDRLYVVNLDITSATTTNRFIFRINNASIKDGTLVAGTDFAQISSTALHVGNQGLRRMALDTQRDILYICHYGNNTVLAYNNVSTYAHGTTQEPARTITNILQPTGVAIDMTNNILFIATINPVSIRVFDSGSTVNGTPAANRTITGASLSQPFGIQYIESLNRLYVANYHATTGRILYYNNARTVNGSPAPTVQSANLAGPVDINVDITR